MWKLWRRSCCERFEFRLQRLRQWEIFLFMCIIYIYKIKMEFWLHMFYSIVIASGVNLKLSSGSFLVPFLFQNEGSQYTVSTSYSKLKRPGTQLAILDFWIFPACEWWKSKSESSSAIDAMSTGCQCDYQPQSATLPTSYTSEPKQR